MNQEKKELLMKQVDKVEERINALSTNCGIGSFANDLNFVSIVKRDLKLANK